MSATRVRIYRETGRGNNWVGRTADGVDVLFPKRDYDLGIGAEVDVYGIRKGDSPGVNFPTGYRLAGQPEALTLATIGVVDNDSVEIQSRARNDYWSVITNHHDKRRMDLPKLTEPPLEVSIGAVLEISGIRERGGRTLVRNCKRAERQYPAEELTEAQRGFIRRLVGGNLIGPDCYPGTVAMLCPPLDEDHPLHVVVLDDRPDTNAELTKAVPLHLESGKYPVGTRVLVAHPLIGGFSKKLGKLVYRL